MNQDNINKIINEALAIESESAKEAGALGFMARALVQATMPHKNPGDVVAWGRENGSFSMVMQPGVIKHDNEFKKIGLPYGSYPRLLLAWLTTEAVRTKNQTIILGDSLSSFMNQLEIIPTGGRWGSIIRLKDQMRRLFSAFICCTYENRENNSSIQAGKNLYVASGYELWWEPTSPNQTSLWQSTVTLGSDFYSEIINQPVPIDMRALKALKGSSMRLDIYTWLTYRMSYLKTKTCIPWEALQVQFGCDFKRTRDFKAHFLNHLRAVHVVYPEAKVENINAGLLLCPSKPHIPLITRG